ncbi:MAG: Fimbrial assembly family protein [Gammaproteobacteria bacterium]|jgi:type IV pilus assembly protein PilN|nr:Fimbrial assembly family protein [Gammaproteobacteria bacterium]
MADINLLPWREQLREEHKRQFIWAMLISAACALLAVVLIHFTIGGMVNNQQSKNDFLQSQVAILDGQIKEIHNLRDEKQRLLARMTIIQELQSDRTFVVRLFDEITRLIPNGIYLESIKREGDLITLTGKAESNSQISQFMRNIAASAWLTRPMLSEIKTINDDQQYKSDFKLQVKQKSSAEELANTEDKK